jgi:hypothetical protein
MNYKMFGVGLLVVFLLGACSFEAIPVTQGTLEAEASYWQQQGGIVGNNECNSTPALANDGTNNVIAYCDYFAGTVLVKKWNGSSWNNVGTTLGALSQPSLVLDSAGNPVLAGSEFSGSVYNITVQRFNGTAWVNVGGPLSGSSAAFSTATEPSLALTSSGTPLVAWSESDGTASNIYVQTFNGTSWVNVGTGVLSGSSATNSSAGSPSLALDGAGNPVVAWSEFDGSINKIYVQRFNGTAWVSVGAGVLNAVGSPATNPSLALNSSGNPTVAWQEGPFSNSSNIYVQRFNGTTWVNVGAGVLDAASGWGIQPSLNLNNGNPTVAWSEFDGASFNVYVQEFRGGNWVNVGTTPLDVTLENGGGYPALALVNGSVNVAWLENFGSPLTRVYVKSYIKNGWLDMGGALDVQASQSATNSSITRKGNNPVVAWEEFDGSSKNIYVKEWNGSVWNAVGGPLDRVLANNAQTPSIAMQSTNRPMVAFQEANNVYVRKWNNSAWINVGGVLDTVLSNVAATPSLALDSSNLPVVAYAENGDIFVKKATGTVLSSVWSSPFGTTPLDTDSSNQAIRPSLVLKSDNNPIIAWSETVGANSNVYAKEWNGTSWGALGGAIDNTVANNAKDIVLALRSDNRPVVAWEESGNIYVKEWTGSAWTSLGGVVDKVTANEALRPALDIRSDNNPVVTWQEGSSSNYNVFVKRWTGSSWVNVSSSALDKTLSRTAQRPAIVLKTNNNPIVAWDEADGSSENIYVEQY